MAKKFGQNKNMGDSSSLFKGETPQSSKEYQDREVQDNFPIVDGVITDVMAGGYVAQVNIGGGTDQAIWLSRILSGISGTDEVTVPAIGSQVSVFKPTSGPSIILGMKPDLGMNDGVKFDIENSGVGYATEDQHREVFDGTQNVFQYFGGDRPVDTLPGDWGIVNEFGNLINLLRGIILLKASNTSQIQLHTLDQLVRVVAGCYEVFSALGEEVTYNSHGNLSKETYISSLHHESLGKEEEDEDISRDGTGEDPKYLKKLADEEAEQKSRVRIFTGFVGDLLRILVTKPDGEGLTEIHVATDGAIKAKSISEIEFRKVSKLATPIRKKKYFEEEETELEDKKPFAYSDDGSKVAQETDKDKWVDEEYSQRKLHEDNWERNEDPPKPEEDDLEEFTEFESKFIQRNDGSMSMIDHEKSSFHLDGKGNAKISAKGDITISAGGKIIMLSGDDTVVKPQRNFEVASTEGDVRVKAENAVQIKSNQKGILLESSGEFVPNGESGEDHEYSGVIIRSTSPNSPIAIESQQNVLIWSENGNIVNRSNQEFRVESDSTAIDSESQIVMTSESGRFELETHEVLCNAYLNIHQSFIATGDRFILSGQSAGTIHGGTATNINHEHEQSEFTYARDCPLGGQKAVFIQKSNSHVPRNLQSVNLANITDILSPFNKTELDKTVFNFTKKVYDGVITEEPWQKDLENTWDLLKDTIGDTAAFPGVDFENYVAYVENEETQDTAGKFESADPSSFKVP